MGGLGGRNAESGLDWIGLNERTHQAHIRSGGFTESRRERAELLSQLLLEVSRSGSRRGGRRVKGCQKQSRRGTDYTRRETLEGRQGGGRVEVSRVSDTESC